MDDSYIKVGEIVTTHGVKGEVKILLYSNDFAKFANYKEVFISGDVKRSFNSNLKPSEDKLQYVGERYEIESVRRHKESALVKFVGLDGIDDVSELIPSVVLVRKSDLVALPEGNYYHFQLIGLDCESETGTNLGVVKEVLELKANTVLVIQNNVHGIEEFMVPLVNDFVKSIDLENRIIVIEDRKGLR